ncbi:MAG: hypothetical protein RIC14_16270 [Filomicrobium sp.]
MKTILSLIAAATVFAAASTANAFDAKSFFEQQQLYGENTSSSQIVSPLDVFETSSD